MDKHQSTKPTTKQKTTDERTGHLSTENAQRGGPSAGSRGALTETDRVRIIMQLINGLPVSDIVRAESARGLKVSRLVVDRVKISNSRYIEEQKRLMLERAAVKLIEVNERNAEQVYKTTMDKSLQVAARIEELMLQPGKLESLNAAQLALVFGIHVDKYNLHAGKDTGRVSVRFNDRREMLDYITGRKAPAVSPVYLNAQPGHEPEAGNPSALPADVARVLQEATGSAARPGKAPRKGART